jgi:Na+/proline symporter
MLGTGRFFMRFSKKASDYFRGGGGMLWWVGGCSLLMTSISAWSFTGGAGILESHILESQTFYKDFACLP